MSFYNMLFGVNSLTPLLKAVLHLDEVKFPDFPDILSWKSEEGERYLSLQMDWGDGRNEDEFYKAREEYIRKCKELKVFPTGRFRDIYIEDGKIVLYTRNGGGNREAYQYIFDLLSVHPNYITDRDDDFDSTYAYIEFSFPEEFKDQLTALSRLETTVPPSEAWQRLIKNLTKAEE